MNTSLNSNSHLNIEIIRILVPSGRHLGKDGGAVKKRPLEPVIVPDVEIQVVVESPLDSKLQIMSDVVSGSSGNISQPRTSEEILALSQIPEPLLELNGPSCRRRHDESPAG